MIRKVRDRLPRNLSLELPEGMQTKRRYVMRRNALITSLLLGPCVVVTPEVSADGEAPRGPVELKSVAGVRVPGPGANLLRNTEWAASWCAAIADRASGPRGDSDGHMVRDTPEPIRDGLWLQVHRHCQARIPSSELKSA